jgi:outer membrane protein OmpA-like peptidoglycan-associated protein
VVAWHGVGGPDVPVQIVEEGPSIVAAVLSHRGAIGLASMSVDRSRVKTVFLRADENGPPVAPTYDSVESGEYPLSRPLRVYSRRANVEAVRKVLSFMLLSEGQAAVARAGFAAIPADRAIQRDLPVREAPAAASVARLSFLSGESGLSVEARGALDRIAERALANGDEVWVIGHAEASEAGEGRPDLLPRERAQSAGRYLQGRGVTVSRIEARGAADPFVSPSREGGRDDRRADVWLLPRR